MTDAFSSPGGIEKVLGELQGSYLWQQARIVTRDPLAKAGIILLSFFLLLAIFAPYIAPHSPFEHLSLPDGKLARLLPPSSQFWLGTTSHGSDVLSQTIIGSRLAILVGLLSTLFIALIGTNIGLISGYFGGKIDSLLMRLTDIAYGIPFLPFAIILVSFLGVGTKSVIAAISLLLWRTSARVIRSQVLSLKERPFVWAARSAGASHWRILYFHIAPNVLPLTFLYLALGVGWAIITEASVSFLGLGDPAVVSWGQMLYYAFTMGAMRRAWWWVLPPGICIALIILACFLVGRAFEEIANPRLRER
jgi:peptide/nickel transport system permease protein